MTVPINWHFSVDEIAYVLEDSGATVLVADAEFADKATAAAHQAGVRVLGRPGEIDATVERLSHEQPAAFAEGRELDLDAAVAYAQRMRGERGRPTFGWDSLTPTEQKVTELAAGGSTNAQIAEHLLMKPATVKTHLTHVFAQLGVATRTELAHTWTTRPGAAIGETDPRSRGSIPSQG